MKTKRKTYAQLERENMDLRAQLASRYALASREIEKASIDYLTASAAVVSITALGGREIMEPVAIIDGLSSETIQAIKNDLLRSYEIATMIKPNNNQC